MGAETDFGVIVGFHVVGQNFSENRDPSTHAAWVQNGVTCMYIFNGYLDPIQDQRMTLVCYLVYVCRSVEAYFNVKPGSSYT